jgi:hypothetical protein
MSLRYRTVYYSKHKSNTREVVYGLTNLPPHKASPAKLLALVRQHWQTERGLHYRRDVTLREDVTRLTVGNSHNMAILNNLVICLSFQKGFRHLAKVHRLFNAKQKEALIPSCLLNSQLWITVW